MKFKDIPSLTKYGNYEVDIPLNLVYEKIKNWENEKEFPLQLQPDFQRCHVWDESKRSKYIEHLLRGGRGGRIVYFNHPGWMTSFKGEFVLVDGFQRITAIKMFFENKLKIFGKYFFKDFEDKIQSDITIKFNVNNLQTREEVLKWYIDLNEGHVAHTEEEINKVKNLLEEERKK